MDLKHFEKHIIPEIEAGFTLEKLRNIIKTGQYAEQDRRESLKETFKPITDELLKIDESIDELKEEFKAAAIEGPPALPEIEGSRQAIEGQRKKKKKSKEPVNTNIHDVIDPETIETAQAFGYPDPMELLNGKDPKEFKDIAREVGKELRRLGGRKAHKKGKEKDEFDKTIKHLQDYKNLIEGYPKNIKPPKHGSGIFYYNNPKDFFDRLHLLGGSIIAGNNSAKNEFSEVAHTLYKLGLFPSEVLNYLLSKFLEI